MQYFRRFLELIRFSHTLFALPFALMSATLAWNLEAGFRGLDLLGILLCMIFARSAAMAFNRLVDRKIDATNPRTAKRHLPAGLLSVPAVTLFTLFCAAAFVASTTLFYYREPSNPWPLYLSGPVLIFICFYSLTKRFTALAHFWLGASLMLAPISAWIAIAGLKQLQLPLWIGLAVLFWSTGFDILYACQDVDYDRKAKLHSIPAKLGVRNSLRLAALLHALMLPFLVILYFQVPVLGTVWLLAVMAVAVLLMVEHRLVRPEDLSRVNAAFFQVNVVISMGLLLVVLWEVLVT
ncbi:putative 4-hydroxybenzoate polyprenyltransferase [Telmatocola sphagniphila]|uniref:4-hydroxybenzoate polyprenyltransferase n=1 Tax=Telmatocola sphagniphila TaxID=1123043 RepID=A0A8E6B5Z0_9BACT|nr:UbiA-like polyprenyltransferase [Telmatocola sphagniphila]QVL31128.1 putative 4-hydroxybenzoate polyprenyltransferase [Telmatocola sphagniphila]